MICLPLTRENLHGGVEASSWAQGQERGGREDSVWGPGPLSSRTSLQSPIVASCWRAQGTPGAGSCVQPLEDM